MVKTFFITGACAFLIGTAGSVFAASEPYVTGSREYYIVNGNNPTMDTGAEVCAKVQKTCVGYTNFDNKACKYFHPNASESQSVNGSKSGFFCDGAPQKGLACENAKNNCQVCPNCNVNVDCNTQIGNQFREMYVECKGTTTPSVSKISGFFKNLRAWPANWWGKLRSQLGGIKGNLTTLFAFKQIKKATITVAGLNGTSQTIEVPTDVVLCEFYQTNKKLVTCGAVKAADTFCAQVMQSRFAKAILCQENGVVVCSNPCNPPEAQQPIKQCAFDNARVRGVQAPPIDLCTTTVKAKMVPAGQNAGTKTPGQECAHGGECTTGICLGQPSDSGIKYFCSCKQNSHDTTCKK